MFQSKHNTPNVMATTESALRRADRVGFAASLLCAIHCALVPILLALLPAFGLNVGGWVDIDQAFVVFATVLGATTLTLGYRRHRAFRAWAVLVPALALVWVGSFSSVHDHSAIHAVVMTIGGVLLATAHFVNLRLTHAAVGTRQS